MSYKKALKAMALFQAYSNASEFIRSHGEEGFTFTDEDMHEAYQKEKDLVVKELDKKSDLWLERYKSYNIEIDTTAEQ